MKKTLFIALASILTYSSLQAQQHNSALTYSMGFGTGDLGDFIGKVSFRGVTFDYRRMVQDNVGVGLTFGWNAFYEGTDGTYTLDNQSLNGKQYRYSNNFPMLVNGAYFLKPGASVNPFFGLGIGTMYTLRNTDMNLYTLEQDAWNFLLQPEFGVQIMANDVTTFHISAKYNHGFAAGSELDNAQSYFTLNVGLAFIK